MSMSLLFSGIIENKQPHLSPLFIQGKDGADMLELL